MEMKRGYLDRDPWHPIGGGLHGERGFPTFSRTYHLDHPDAIYEVVGCRPVTSFWEMGALGREND